MASGRTHQIASASAFVVGGITCAYYVLPPPVSQSVLLGLLTGIFISPDLDIDASTAEERLLEKIPIIGPIFSAVWQGIWFPYAKLIPHRSPISHWPILGTAVRAAYLWLIARVILLHFGILPPAVDFWFLGAWAIQDTLHWVLDSI